MKIYFAPLESITGYIFRNAYNGIYGHVDKYFVPFISPPDPVMLGRGLISDPSLADKLNGFTTETDFCKTQAASRHRLSRVPDGITNTHSITTRMFLESEGGHQHCQIGNHKIATSCIMDWIDSINNDSVNV